MLERFYLLKDHIASVLIKQSGPAVPDMLTKSDLSSLKELIDFLEPFQQAITTLSAEKTVTCSKIIPLIHCLTKNVEETVASSPAVLQVKENLLASLKKRFGHREESELHALTLVDPRFKRIHFTDPIAHAKVITRAAELVKEEQNGAVHRSFSVYVVQEATVVLQMSTLGFSPLFQHDIYRSEVTYRK